MAGIDPGSFEDATAAVVEARGRAMAAVNLEELRGAVLALSQATLTLAYLTQEKIAEAARRD